MFEKGSALLAIVAIVVVAGVIVAFISVVRSQRKHLRTEEDEFPSFQEELELTKPAPSITGPTGDFWKLFSGDDQLALWLRRGGRFSTRESHRLTVNRIGEYVVVVVAQRRGAEEVWRYVCHREKGIFSKNEPREPQDGHIADIQAHRMDRTDMELTPDPKVKELTALLGTCYPTPVSAR